MANKKTEDMKRVITTNYKAAEEDSVKPNGRQTELSVPEEYGKIFWKSEGAYNNNREMGFNV